MKFASEKMVLPAFPKTAHLPHEPNTDHTDAVASVEEAGIIFTHPINIEEKIDCASMGTTLYEGHPLIRNRDHILRKGYVKDTAAKKQFASAWTWFYNNKAKFEAIQEIGPYSVYGEWCVAQHGLAYTALPDWFVAYDLYDYERSLFLPPPDARKWLAEAGFTVPYLHHQGVFDGGYEELAALARTISQWTEDKTEGIYVKVYDDKSVTHRFKMVRPDFVRGALWNPKKLTKNKLAEKK
jgi:hypothetical protein